MTKWQITDDNESNHVLLSKWFRWNYRKRKIIEITSGLVDRLKSSHCHSLFGLPQTRSEHPFFRSIAWPLQLFWVFLIFFYLNYSLHFNQFIIYFLFILSRYSTYSFNYYLFFNWYFHWHLLCVFSKSLYYFYFGQTKTREKRYNEKGLGIKWSELKSNFNF